MKTIVALLVLVIASLTLPAGEKKSGSQVTANPATSAAASAAPGEGSLPEGVVCNELRYDGRINADEARFVVDVSTEVTTRKEVALTLFEGELALLPPAKLPAGLRVDRDGNRYRLLVSKPGKYQFKLELIARINRAEPWSEVSLRGPAATIASVSAEASGPGVELQLLTGTTLESAHTNNLSRVKGFLGADRALALRWQTHAAEVTRKAVLTSETTATAQITPTVIKYVTQLRYDILQGRLSKLAIALPASQALTRLVGDQIRDWQISLDGDRQLLTVEFIRPLEKNYPLTIYSEQTVEASPASATVAPPQPLEVERDSGGLTLSAEDVQVDIDSATGLRQINAPEGALAAYRFNARPFALALKLRRIEPVVTAADRVTVRPEETRLLVVHRLALNVEKSGLYALDLKPDPAFVVADVRGEGVEDWKVTDGTLRINFGARVLGRRTLDVQLEQALKTFPPQMTIAPLRVTGASKETAQIGAAPAAGIGLKTGELAGVREVPVNRLANRTDETLAWVADQGDWKLTLASERMPARVVADIFNLVTIGDGLVGGSATIRYGIVGQGVQEFRVKIPEQWKNVEFTGQNIRRKEQQGGIWMLGLQDKAWGAYTLVVTYDYQFDPKGAALPVGGIHVLDVERETGSIALTTAASLQLSAKSASDALRRVDDAALAEADRALVTRSVLLAYQYTGGDYALEVDVKRHDELPVLSAVADRTQLTSLLTETGELLTQASFMVKNNDKQYQRFQLPKGAKFWSCQVNAQPARPEREGDWLLVPLPRGANRDHAFAVDIVYAEQKGALRSLNAQTLQLSAPRTDVPNTFAEWELFAPPTFRFSAFAGNMSVARGAAYGLREAWDRFVTFYRGIARELGLVLLLALGAAGASVMLAAMARAGFFRAIGHGLSVLVRGLKLNLLFVLLLVAVGALLAGLMLPSLAQSKKKAQRITAINNLKQVGLAAILFANDNNNRLPSSYDEMMRDYLNTPKVTIDPESNQPFTYTAGGLQLDRLSQDSILAYSPPGKLGRSVLFADGHVEYLKEGRFEELTRRGLTVYASEQAKAQAQQQAAVVAQQMPGAAGAAPRVAGMGAIRIEIPRIGEPFVFTKVLNIRDEPLTVGTKVVDFSRYLLTRALWQIGALLAGAGVCVWQLRRARRSSLALTCGLALVFGAIGSMLLTWQVLHLGFIAGVPMLLVALLVGLIARFWPHRAEAPVEAPDHGPVTVPSAAAGLALLLFASTAYAAPEPTTAAPKTAPPSPGVSIVSAVYNGTVNERVAQFDVELKIVTEKPDQRIALFGDDVAVQQFSPRSGDAKLLREGQRVVVTLPRKGEANLQVKLLVKLGGEVTKRQLGFGIPAALTSRFTLAIDQPEADVEFPTAVSFKRATAGQQTRVEAMIGSAERVELCWTPRVKRAAEITATVISHNASLVSLASGTMNTRSVLNYQVTQGELRQARVRLPAGHRLLRVEGESIRTWQLKEGAEPEVIVELMKGVTPGYRLTIETESPLAAFPTTVTVEVPHSADVKRETGIVALRGDEEVELFVESTGELQRVDSEEFARVSGTKVPGVFHAFRFLKPEFALRVRAAAVQPQVEAVAANFFTVGAETVALTATVNYTIKHAGVFALKLGRPAGYRVENVSGTNVAQWNERVEGGAPVLEVSLKERMLGTYALRVELARHFKELPKTLALAGVQPIGAAKLNGFVSVSADAGVAVKTAGFEGLTEIPAAQLPSEANSRNGGPVSGSALAFKFISAGQPTATAWRLDVATESVEAWIRAEVANTLTVSDVLVSGRALVRYDIQNAPVKDLRLRIPAAFRNVEISGANIRRRDHEGESWRVELQSKVRGPHLLTVTWDLPRTKTNLMQAAGVTAEGVERETGILAIVARPPLQVSEAQASGELQRVDARDWPDWAGRPNDATVLAYRYARPGYRLTLDARRFDEAEVLQALVENVRLSTVVADDGQMMNVLTLSVRNNGRQFVELALPPGATVWSAFVAGQPIRPSRREDKLLVPIERTGPDNPAIPIELTYVTTNLFPLARSGMKFIAPVVDLPFQNARWELYLPSDYAYSDFHGTMKNDVVGGAVAASFSQVDYSKQEAANREAEARGVKSQVASAQQKLSKGNVKEAAAEYNQARARSGGKGSAADRDLQELDAGVRRMQASNLINAQNEFMLRNAQQFAPQQPGAVPNQPAAQYDNAAAEAQWTKLQQAQETVEAKVQPLRVNLPTRGQRLVFTQMLQTEAGRPMTIELMAANSRASGFVLWGMTAASAFLALWAVVGMALKGMPAKATTNA